jgi:2-deoxy-D-gluconate 3-dehydrogenase
MASTEETVRAGREALAHFGTVDILVNNAGISRLGMVLDLSVEAWDETQAVNMRAPFLLTQAVAQGMVAQRSGKIINISSVAAATALPEHAAYCTSKGGLNMLTKVTAVELGPYNIQCNAVCPTVILTPMGIRVWGDAAKSEPMLAKIPLGRFGAPQEVADLVLYLAAPASEMITGQAIFMDGGFTAL